MNNGFSATLAAWHKVMLMVTGWFTTLNRMNYQPVFTHNPSLQFNDLLTVLLE